MKRDEARHRTCNIFESQKQCPEVILAQPRQSFPSRASAQGIPEPNRSHGPFPPPRKAQKKCQEGQEGEGHEGGERHEGDEGDKGEGAEEGEKQFLFE